MGPSAIRQSRTLQNLGFAMVVLLLIQYALGMYTNLFVEIPQDVNGWQWMSHSAIVVSHVIVGTLSAVAAVAILVLALRARRRAWVVSSVVGLAAICTSLITGSSFMVGQSDTNSFLMAVGLGVGLMAYAAGIYASAIRGA
jgi:hypothetical protein